MASSSLAPSGSRPLSRLEQVLSSRPATDHDSQPSPTPSLATFTPSSKRAQQLLFNQFTPTKNTRSSAPSSLKNKSTQFTPTTTPKKQKTSSNSNSISFKRKSTSKNSKYSGAGDEEQEQDELDLETESIQRVEEEPDLAPLPITPASSISTSSDSTFGLMEYLRAGKVQQSPRRGRRVGKVDMGWISPSKELQRWSDQEHRTVDLHDGELVGKGKGKGMGRSSSKRGSDVRKASTPGSPTSSRNPSWKAPVVTPSKRKEAGQAVTLPPSSNSKFISTSTHGATLIDSQGWAAAGVLGKGERIPYLGSPSQDELVGLGIGQSDHFSQDLSPIQQVKPSQTPSHLQPSYDPLSGFSFNSIDNKPSGPTCLKPQEVGRGEGFGTKLIACEVAGIGRMALHEELTSNLEFLNERADQVNSQASGSLHRFSDAEGSTSSSERTSGGSSVSTNPTSIGTPGSSDHVSSAPHSGPSPSFSLCSHFPSEPRTPMSAGMKAAGSIDSQETTGQALAAVLNFGQESAKKAAASLNLKNTPSLQTLKKLQEVKELVQKSRVANRKRKSGSVEAVFGSEVAEKEQGSKRPRHSLRLIGSDAPVTMALPSLAWPDFESNSPWSSTTHTVNSGQAEKESIMKWLEIKPSALSSPSSEYEIDAEQRAEIEENQLQWSQHPMVAKALRDRARKEEARRIVELEMAREQRARDRAYGRASARSHAKNASTHYPKVQKAARASVRQRARKELKAHPDALDGVAAGRHKHKPSGAYLIQPPAPVYQPSPELRTTPHAKGRKGASGSITNISIKTKGGRSQAKQVSTPASSAGTVFGCSCGRGDDEDDTPPMVQCDSCNKWHHLPCIGVDHEDQLDAEWYCDACCNPEGLLVEDDANSVATDPLDLELDQRSPASESSFNVLSTPRTHGSTPISASNKFFSGQRMTGVGSEPVFAQPSESPKRQAGQPLSVALAPSPPMMSSSRYRGPPSNEAYHNPHYARAMLYNSPGHHPHAHLPRAHEERYGRGRVRAERIGGWLETKAEEDEANEPGSPLARKSTPARKEDLYASQGQDLPSARRVSGSVNPISRPRTPTTPKTGSNARSMAAAQGLRTPPGISLGTPSRLARFEERAAHQFSEDEDHQHQHGRDPDDVFSTPSRLMAGSSSWGYGKAAGGASSRANSQTPGKITGNRGDLVSEASGSHQRRDSSQWGLPSALRTPSRDVLSRGAGSSFTPTLGVDHSGGYSVGLPSLVFSSGGLEESHLSNHESMHSNSSTSRAWQLQSPTSTTRAGAARARQSSTSHSFGLGTPGGMLRTPELQPTFNRGTNNSSVRGAAHSRSRKSSFSSHPVRRDRSRSRSPSPTKRSRNGELDFSLPSLKDLGGRSNGRTLQQEDEDEDYGRSDNPPTSSSPFPPTPTFEGSLRRFDSSMDESRILSSARRLATVAASTPLTKSQSQPYHMPFRTPPSEESNRLALSALLDSPADLAGPNRKRNSSGFSNRSGTGLGIGLALDDVLDWS